MVAGIFHAHGVWTGPSRPGDKYNEKGYFENRAMMAKMKKVFGFEPLDPPPQTSSQWRPIVEGIIAYQGYESGPWLFKTGVHYSDIWGDFSPKVVKIWRDRERILESYERYGGIRRRFSRREVETIVDTGLERLWKMDGFLVDTDAVVEGDFGSIRDALEGCGLRYSEETVAGFIVPEIWNAG